MLNFPPCGVIYYVHLSHNLNILKLWVLLILLSWLVGDPRRAADTANALSSTQAQNISFYFLSSLDGEHNKLVCVGPPWVGGILQLHVVVVQAHHVYICHLQAFSIYSCDQWRVESMKKTLNKHINILCFYISLHFSQSYQLPHPNI